MGPKRRCYRLLSATSLGLCGLSVSSVSFVSLILSILSVCFFLSFSLLKRKKETPSSLGCASRFHGLSVNFWGPWDLRDHGTKEKMLSTAVRDFSRSLWSLGLLGLFCLLDTLYSILFVRSFFFIGKTNERTRDLHCETRSCL